MIDMPEDFKTAIEHWKNNEKENSRQQIESTMKQLWSQLGSITVFCPACQGKMDVRTIKSIKCIFCGRRYQIYPKRENARIIPSSVKNIKILHQIHSLETTGQFESIL